MDSKSNNDDGNINSEHFYEGSSNPNLTNNIDPLEQEKIKGDAIGNTMYSERFVLKTLLKLMEDEWTEEMENDLCSLWDMTTERDVVNFLLSNDFVKLSLSIIKKTDEIRLVEIMVGIVGNMCCFPEPCMEVFTSDYEVYLSLIKISDTPLLIQLMRLFKTLLFSNNEHYNVLINENVLEQINFILCSSQNSELIIYTLQVLSEIIDKKKTDILIEYNVMLSINEAFKQLLKNISDDVDVQNYLSHEHEKIITAYLKVLQNINLSLDDEVDEEKYHKIFSNLQTNSEDTLSYLETILSLCCDIDVFNSMTQCIEFYIYCSTQFIMLLKPEFSLKILELLINIFDIILCEKIQFDRDILPEMINLICYMINKGDIDVLRKLFKTWPKEKIVFLLKDNIMDKSNCHDDFVDKFNKLCYM